MLKASTTFNCLAAFFYVFAAFVSVVSATSDRVGPGTEAEIKAPLILHLWLRWGFSDYCYSGYVGAPEAPGPFGGSRETPTGQLGNTMFKQLYVDLPI